MKNKWNFKTSCAIVFCGDYDQVVNLKQDLKRYILIEGCVPIYEKEVVGKRLDIVVAGSFSDEQEAKQ